MRRLFFVSLLPAIFVSPVCARIVDDFSVGPVVAQKVDSTTAAIVEQTDLDPAHVLGGSRLIQVGFGGGGATQTATVDTTARKFTFSTAGDTLGYLTLRYGSETQPLNLNLAADGSQYFAIKMTDVMPGTFSPPAFRVYGAGTSKFLSLNPQPNAVTDTVELRFPFSEFPPGLVEDVDRIEINVGRWSRNSQFSIVSIATVVPEPATLIIAGLAGAFLLLQRY